MDEKRQFPRFPLTAPVTCFRYGRRVTMRALDISQEGLKLETNFDFRVGESVDLTILVNSTKIRRRGKVIAIEELGHKVQARVRFTRTSILDQSKLSDYLHSLSLSPFQKRLSGALFIVALVAASLTIIIAYTQYFHSGPDRGPLGEDRQLKEDGSATRASAFKIGAKVESPKAVQRSEEERELAVEFSGAALRQEGDIREPSKNLAPSRMRGVVSVSGVASQATKDTTRGPGRSGQDDLESTEVSKMLGEVSARSSEQQVQEAAVIKKGAPPGVSRPEIRRSAIAVGVEDREPVGISHRVSVGQGRVYCWMHVVNGNGGVITVRWIGRRLTIGGVDLPVGSNSWRTWSYLSLKPGMIGPARVEILDENGEILKTLSFEITE